MDSENQASKPAAGGAPDAAANRQTRGRREIRGGGGVTIGGAPVSYVAILAAIVAALAFVPASVVIGGTGAGWPLHDAIHPLIGLLLGPIAGPIASGVGILVGMVIAPYTSLGPFGFLIGVGSAFAVGMVTRYGKWQWAAPVAITAALLVVYFFQAINTGISPGVWLANTWTVIVGALLVSIPPVRLWFIRTIRDENAGWLPLIVALYIPFFMGSVTGIMFNWVPAYAVNPWPPEVWQTVLPPVIALERTVFPLIGALVGTGVLAGLRRTSFVKPRMGTY